MPGHAVTVRRRAGQVFSCYRVLSRAYFHLPILWVWFVEGHGVRIWVAAVLLAVYSVTLTFGAPLARRLQQVVPPARSMLIGEVAKAGGLLGLVLAGGNPAAVIAAQLVGGIGYSLGQGPDSVLLRSLYRDEEAAEYSGVESRSMSLVFVSVLIAGVIGGLLYGWVPSSPFIASIAGTGLAAAAALWLGHLALASRMLDNGGAVTAGGGRPGQVTASASSSQKARRHVVRLTAADWQWILYYAAVRGLALAAFVALLPMVFFVDLKVHVSLFGIVLGSFSLFAYISGRYGLRFAKAVPDVLIPPLSVAALAGSFALFAVAHALIVALVAMAVLGAVNGVVRPLAMSRLQSIPSRTAAERGAAVATMERSYGAFNAIAIVGGGIIAGGTDVQHALWTYSLLAAALGAGWLVAVTRGWVPTGWRPGPRRPGVARLETAGGAEAGNPAASRGGQRPHPVQMPSHEPPPPGTAPGRAEMP